VMINDVVSSAATRSAQSVQCASHLSAFAGDQGGKRVTASQWGLEDAACSEQSKPIVTTERVLGSDAAVGRNTTMLSSRCLGWCRYCSTNKLGGWLHVAFVGVAFFVSNMNCPVTGKHEIQRVATREGRTVYGRR
jgi:hypothetical protein